MSNSKQRDRQLKKDIANYEAKIGRYRAVRSAIERAGFTHRVDLPTVGDALDIYKTIIDTINGNDGYISYLSSLSSKLQEHHDTIEEYRTFVGDSTQAFSNLYTTLGTAISSLESQVANAKTEFNQGHHMTEALTGDYYLW